MNFLCFYCVVQARAKCRAPEQQRPPFHPTWPSETLQSWAHQGLHHLPHVVRTAQTKPQWPAAHPLHFGTMLFCSSKLICTCLSAVQSHHSHFICTFDGALFSCNASKLHLDRCACAVCLTDTDSMWAAEHCLCYGFAAAYQHFTRCLCGLTFTSIFQCSMTGAGKGKGLSKCSPLA